MEPQEQAEQPKEQMTLPQLVDMRKRILAGQIPTKEELRDAIAVLRQDRVSGKPKKKGKQEVVAATNEQLNDLF